MGKRRSASLGAFPGAILGGRMPTAALRASMARSASGASRDQPSWSPAPSRTRLQPSADARCASSTRADPASEALPVAPRAELASAAGGDGCPRCVAWSWIGRLEPRTAVPRVAADLAGKLSAPPGIGRRAGGRMCPDRRRVELLRPSAAGCQATPESDMGAQRPKSRVGAAGLGPAKPERGKDWKPSWGFQFNVRRAG